MLTHRTSTLIADIGDTLKTKSGGVFCLCAGGGDIDASVSPAHGLYFHYTRFLDRARLRLDDADHSQNMPVIRDWKWGAST